MTKKTINDELTQAFNDVYLNPSDKNIKKYKELENALLTFWLKEHFLRLAQGINDNIKRGSSDAVKQLKAKGLSRKKAKSNLLNNLAKAKREQAKSDLNKVISGIKANSRRMISDIQEEQILGISASKKRSWKDVLLTYGVAYFTDRAGKAWQLDRYVEMLQDTAEYTAYRDSMFAKSGEYDNDLVRIIHNGNEPPCDLCDPFQGKILSLSGKTKGYMTVDEAKSYGLFHINCYCDFELAPTEHAGDKEVIFSEANEKQRERYERGNRSAVIMEAPRESDFKEFGKEYTGVKGIDAINLLLKEKQGFVRNAFSREDLGGIALIWGDKKKGLFHIITRRAQTNQNLEAILSSMQDIIENGKLKFDEKRGTFEIKKDGKKVIISPSYKGKKLNFIITAFEIYK